MARLKDKLYEKIEEWRPRTAHLMKEYGDVIVDEVRVSQVIGGMRGIKCMVSDISYLDPMEGIRYRGYTLPRFLRSFPGLKALRCLL